ncbi:hypothetical protein KC19_3G172600, partial [Ceratodon purpureus]
SLACSRDFSYIGPIHLHPPASTFVPTSCPLTSKALPRKQHGKTSHSHLTHHTRYITKQTLQSYSLISYSLNSSSCVPFQGGEWNVRSAHCTPYTARCTARLRRGSCN